MLRDIPEGEEKAMFRLELQQKVIEFKYKSHAPLLANLRPNFMGHNLQNLTGIQPGNFNTQHTQNVQLTPQHYMQSPQSPTYETGRYNRQAARIEHDRNFQVSQQSISTSAYQ